MERSGSQKALLVLSIIEIVGAVFAFLAGALFLFAGGVLGGASSAELAADGISATEAAQAASISVALAIVLIVMGIWGLLCGIFGIRAANDASRIGIVWVFCLIDLILCIVSLIMALVGGTFEWSILLSLVVAAFMFWLAGNIKRQA